MICGTFAQRATSILTQMIFGGYRQQYNEKRDEEYPEEERNKH